MANDDIHIKVLLTPNPRLSDILLQCDFNTSGYFLNKNINTKLNKYNIHFINENKKRKNPKTRTNVFKINLSVFFFNLNCRLWER